MSQLSEPAPLPDDLPPVRPPSPVFVLQLFVVPGLIVMVIVGIWLLFGRMASSEQDWRALVTELKHPNEHRRWRAAHGLAQLLKADQELGPRGQQLAQNGEIAESLAEQFTKEIKRDGKSDADLNYQAYLARTLGLFDTTKAVIPALELGILLPHEQETDTLRMQKLEVRKNALSSVMVLAGRLEAQGTPLESPSLMTAVLEVSHNEDRLLRQVSAYTLGLLRGQEADDRLLELLDDADDLTRVNAAIGLARKEDTRGFRVLKDVLSAAVPATTSKSSASQTPEQIAIEKGKRFERLLSMKNALPALDRMSEKLTPAERAEAVALVQPLAENFDDLTIRHAAAATLRTLQP